ncbi:MAG: TolC family protein [Bacteroidales bacterium]|nr:TolC family protein [Bacteroidales bacterium]
MKNIKIINLLLLIALLTQGLGAQELLTAEDAIRKGLENNFSIRLVKQDALIAGNNVKMGIANFLPVLDIDAVQNFSVLNTRQEYLSGQVNDLTGAKSDAFNAGAQLNWTLFDGMQMFVNYDRVKQFEQKSELLVLLTVEATINNILVNFFELIHMKQQLQVIEKTISVDLERVKLANDMLAIGAGSRLEVLQAEVDLNADSALLMGIADRIDRARVNLNQLLARPADVAFEVPDSFEVNKVLVKQTLEEKMLRQNTSLQLSLQDELLAQLTLREIRGRQSPTLGFNMGYNYINQSSESGFLQSNRSTGLTYGLNANLKILDGLNTRRERNNATILLDASRIRTESLVSELQAELTLNYNSYLNKLRLLAMELQNVEAASENLDIATERYRLGDLSGIEFREAQRNFMTTEARLLNVRLDIKTLEINLLQLAGDLPPEM